MSGLTSTAPPIAAQRRNSWLDAGILALLLYGLAMFAASFVPAGAVAHDLGQFSGGGDASAEIAERFAAIAGRARIAAAAILALALAAATQRRRLAAFLRPHAPASRLAMPSAPATSLAATLRANPILAAAGLAILAAGVALRLYYLDRPMRHDEAWTYLDYARMPLYAIPVRYSDVNDHVLNTFLIHIATALFGNAPAAIRLPALLFGICVIPAGLLLARALAGARAGIIAAALLASSVPLIEFSVNARGYEALTCFFLVTLLAGHRAITTTHRAAWAVVIAAGTLGLYTVPTMMIPLAAAFVWFALLAWQRPNKDRLAARLDARLDAMADIVAAGALIVLATALLYVPILIANGPGVLLHSPGIHSSSGFGSALLAMPAFLSQLFQHWTRAYGSWLSALVLVLVPVSLALPGPARRPLALLLVALAAATLCQLVLLKDPGPFRIWLPFLAALLVMAAIGLDAALALRPPYRTPAAALAALALCATISTRTLVSGVILQSDETAFYPPAREAALALRGASPADLIGITAVRGDEVTYYALRDGIILRPVFTGADLRYFRRTAATPPQPAPQPQLILLIDGPFDHCDATACAALARPDVKFAAGVATISSAHSLTALRANLE